MNACCANAARPPLALERLRELGPERLLYESTQQGPGGNGPQILTPLELLDRLAALVPPPRIHRHRYFGVLAILAHLGEPTAPPRIAPARGLPLWHLPDAGTGDFNPHAQPAPEYEFDQRIA